jgi:hypothetical protein
MTHSPVVIKLADLAPKLPSVRFRNGEVHQVEPLSGNALKLVLAAGREGGTSFSLWEAALLCLPTATREAVLSLTMSEVDHVLAIASGQASEKPPG